MKNKMYLRTGVLLLLLCTCINCKRNKSTDSPGDASISFYSTPDVIELTNEWAGVYIKLNPEVKINVLGATGSSLVENPDNNQIISFVSDESRSIENTESLWKVVVGRDVIVPIIHSENPLADEIYQRGISPVAFSMAITDPASIEWGALLGTENHAHANVYMTDRASKDPGLAKFLNINSFEAEEIQISDAKELIPAFQTDIYAIAFCNLTDIIGVHSRQLLEGINLLPIDMDGNGTIDYREDIYADLITFSRSVGMGNYPPDLSSNIYAVAASSPTKSEEIAFLKWITTRGQVLLDNHGFSELQAAERTAQVEWMDSFVVSVPGSEFVEAKQSGFYFRPLLIVMATILLVFLSLSLITYLRERNLEVPAQVLQPRLAFNEDLVKSPPGLHYDKSHTWAFMDEDGLVKVGIDDFLQHITGNITRIKMKSPGERIRKGRHALSLIQNGKQLDISAPVSGVIKEFNINLLSSTSILNTSPCSLGWVYKIEPTNWLKEVQFLIMGKTYSEWLRKEFTRLKEYLQDSVSPQAVEYAHVLQDGGEIKDSILEDFGPEAWEDFQTNFIDVSY